MSNNEVTELTWENGQLAIHGLGGLLPTKPTWGRASDTLESMVHQAILRHKELLPSHHDHDHDHDQINPANTSSTLSVSVSAVKSTESSGFAQVPSGSTKKRTRRCKANFKSGFQAERERGSACASGSATFYRENDDTTMMTRASLEECPSNSKGKTVDEDSASHGGSEDMNEEQQKTKGETSRSQTTRRSRASANHNMSERRRRDKINEKMKALQRLVPNASKSDKASMLDEVIEYLKQLQAQVQMMSTRSLPQMIMPTALGMQQQMQMSILARMGMGVGLGMGPMGPVGNVARQSMPSVIHPGQVVSASTSPFFSPPFVMPPVMPSHAPNATAINNSVPFNNPYCPFFPQPMNMELYNKMAAMYQQQMNQTTQPTTSNPMPPANVQGG